MQKITTQTIRIPDILEPLQRTTETYTMNVIHRHVTIEGKQYLVAGSTENSFTVCVRLARGGYRGTTSQRLWNAAVTLAQAEQAAEQAAEKAAEKAADVALELSGEVQAPVLAFEEKTPAGYTVAPSKGQWNVTSPDGAFVGSYSTLAKAAEGAQAHVKVVRPSLPTTAAEVIENFEGQIVRLKAALETADPEAHVLEIQGLYSHIDGHGKAHACGVLKADQYTAFEARMRAPQLTNGNGISATVRSLPEAIRLSIMGLESSIQYIRTAA